MDELRENGCKECRLVREDGTEWIVTDFDLDAIPPQVNAVRPGRSNGHESSQGNGNGSSPETGEDETAIREETLAKGDRLEWLGEDGRVIWSFKSPLTS